MMKTRILGILLAMVCLALTPAAAMATTQSNVSYVQRSWLDDAVQSTGKTAGTCTVVEEITTTMTDGWYYVSADVTVNSRITVTGDVHLILADGATLTANSGIQVAAGNSLTIYGQKGDSGKLSIRINGLEHAAIGGNNGEAGGSITIHGGDVYTEIASNGDGGACIGGGNRGNGGSVTIFGGKVTADSHGWKGAGIGGGNQGNGGPVKICGGTVTAKANWGNTSGSGIGGGGGGNGGDVEIYGGSVYAYAHVSGSGIGGSIDNNGGTLKIYGGQVTAESARELSSYKANYGVSSSTTIYGGELTAKGVNGATAFKSSPTIDASFVSAKVWYGGSESAAVAAGMKHKDELSGKHRQNFVRIKEGYAVVYYMDENKSKTVLQEIPADTEIGGEVTLKNPFTRGGYAFTGWEYGTGTVPANQTSVTFNGEDIVLYGQWVQLTPDKITISGTPKDKYAPGESFDPTGMTVTVTYEESDGNTYTETFEGEEISSENGFTIMPETLQKGDNEVTITYTVDGGKVSKDHPITVLWSADTPVIEEQFVNSGYYLLGQDADELSVKVAEAPEGNKITYQWYSRKKDSTDGVVPILDATGSTFVPPTNEKGTTEYYCVVTNTNNNATVSKQVSFSSNIAEITVGELRIVRQPADQQVIVGQRAEFSVEVIGDNLNYQWLINRNDGNDWAELENANGPVYVTEETTLACNGYQYMCKIFDQNDNLIESSPAVLSVSVMTPMPATGDKSRLGLWLALLAGCAGLAAIYRRKSADASLQRK